ncbi:gamma-glutamyltransferase [Streptomyces sp. IBSBF 2435]|uniref:gamma-glutamyltransferase n=1 Tax=Streptomyces sp. IBSBF 2435 TaxID=2903531 RepID=UPI002FDC627C
MSKPSNHTPDIGALNYDDRIDVPVLLRDGPGGRPWKKWRTGKAQAWERPGLPDTDGWYLPTTTWREIIHAACNVGRDLTPWLDTPQMAAGELVARIAPLYAFLALHQGPTPHAYNAGRRLTSNRVLERGTEASARGAFSYRLGMTMAEWVCQRMGLGQTFNLEDSWPADVEDPAAKLKKLKGQSSPRPDLWGTHTTERRYWLIEAKGGDIGPRRQQKGWEQLQGGSSVMAPYGYDHRLILCSAGLLRKVHSENDLIVVVGHEHHPGSPAVRPQPDASADRTFRQKVRPRPKDLNNADQLGQAARSQMLVYLMLRAAAEATSPNLFQVPLSRSRTYRRRATGPLTLLEHDEETLALRQEQRDLAIGSDVTSRFTAEAGLENYLACRVPGTDVTLGLSRRLYNACEQLFIAESEMFPATRAEDQPLTARAEKRVESDMRLAGIEYRQRAEDAREIVNSQVWAAFDTAPHGWDDVFRDIGPAPRIVLTPTLSEAATSETYLAVEPRDLFTRIKK